MFNNEIVECMNKYKYLGISLDGHLDFNITVTVLASSASRALGSIYTKFAKLKGIGFSTFPILYHSGVDLFLIIVKAYGDINILPKVILFKIELFVLSRST